MVLNENIMAKVKIRVYNPIWGVPITFLDKYCPEQFEIVELPNTSIPGVIKNAEGKIGNRITYARVLIKKR